MPGLNGFELYKRLRQADESIKVLILTASQESVHNEQSGDMILKVARKPIIISKLLVEIDSILRLEKSKVIV